MATARMQSRRPRTWWAAPWIVAGLATILVEAVAASASTVPYAPLQQTISDLGMTTCADVEYGRGLVAVCSPAHGIANAVWAVAALAIVVGAVGVRSWLGRGASAVVAAVGAVVGGLGQLGVALWPIDVDLTLHAVAGLVGFVAQNVALVAAAVALRRRRAAAVAASLGGAIGLAATVVVPVSESLGLPIGLVERLAVYPFLIGVALAGVLAIVDRRAGLDGGRARRG